ncbi:MULTISPECIES: extracellular catalytic domain type 1 short-chain-length polyhydroxyalkanoate depolymerase [Streptomyces]|uniref:Esterase n=1 Tax=Streptomyces xinghaiensis TaxID=1038928 RepID=A0A3M8F6T2_9ACTN|nr:MULTISPECIES: PHB depolymerase family esterase [Streptomyces]PQM22833.1 esterase [Streptomyces xinghaiensis]RKM98003.1 esterase [Streptomyces xinghaiensis]RNC73859.1 esterase [Streptomyces xinghaiensis]
MHPFPPERHRARGARTRTARTLTLVLSLVALVLGGLTAVPAQAAGLREVTGFGSNPGNLRMFRYVPDGLPTGRPVVVALHGCTQSASGFDDETGWTKWADAWGFALVLPEQKSANNMNTCFNWFEPSDMARGSGEAPSVKQMADRTAADLGSDTARVYVTGLSAGGAMTSVMAAAYPDVFAGAAVVAGLPYDCARTVVAGLSCMNPGSDLGPRQWGDKVRAAHPSYDGPRPVMSLWHGTNDSTVKPVNLTELVEQWTNVHGTDTVADISDTVDGYPHQVYENASGDAAVESYSITGMQHGQPADPGGAATQCGIAGQYFPDMGICASYRIGRFWGLDSSQGGSELPAPAGPAVTATTETTVSLSWEAVDGAAAYRVHRDGDQKGSPSGPSFTDTGLSPGTTYAYTVAAVDDRGRAGPATAAVRATTAGSAHRCFTDNNYQQVAAGRAHQALGTVYANGSGQNMGLYNVFVTHTLEETSPGHFVIADSDCPSP